MSPHPSSSPVAAWIDTLTLPTYPVHPPEPNPMFFEKRNIQGAAGNIYPNPFTDRLSSQAEERQWEVIYLENEYIQMILMPALGGRVFAGLDKTNGYDFFYRHEVIKPALIGLFGPWISGGVEFNWPQHHRPSTFMPVEYAIENAPDGSVTVWLSEHEPMNRTKGMVGICLYPGKALVDMKVQLYNRTPYPQTFLWWANAAVHIHPQYQVIFPPDVHYAVFHTKQHVISFPIARGVYNNGMDLGEGVDATWYTNFPIPTSFFASPSKYEFFGGYDHRRNAGVVHVADRGISPGKKFFTWGNGPFGQQWQRNLADKDDPYLELMAGVYTDNQPDFSWMRPYETKTFHQYWYPLQRIGPPKNANQFAAVNLEIDGQKAKLGVQTVGEQPAARLRLSAAGEGGIGETVLFEQTADLRPGSPLVAEATLPAGVAPQALTLQALAADGSELIRYQPEPPFEGELPPPYQPPASPQETATLEELYLVGLHLEQYRHPVLEPESYWEEALRRDPGDLRCNNALGRLHLRRGDFARAADHFRRALERLTWRNLNPFDAEPFYHLGLALRFLGRNDEAYDQFAKAAWDAAWASPAYFQMAQVDALKGRLEKALENLERCLQTNVMHLQARRLKAALLRRLGRLAAAAAEARQAVQLDPLEHGARHELALCLQAMGDTAAAQTEREELRRILRGDPQNILDLAFDEANAGLFDELNDLLAGNGAGGEATYPMLLYLLAWAAWQTGDHDLARQRLRQAALQPPDYCFPWRLEELLVLRFALQQNPQDARAAYYLGNLLYDKRQFDEAIRLWETAARLEPNFSIPWRNLGLAAYNVRGDLDQAIAYHQRALQVNPADPRLLGELDQLRKRKGVSPAERLAELEKRLEIVRLRDDVTIELVSLYNRAGQPDKALEILRQRLFHPWEGGEGLVAGNWTAAHLLKGRQALEAGSPQEALAYFEQAMTLPHTLGEAGFERRNAASCYYAGQAKASLGDSAAAEALYQQAAALPYDGSPSSDYYQALALKALGREDEARQRLQAMLAQAQERVNQPFERNYFYPMNPSALFVDDLNKLSRLHWTFRMGMAYLGLGEKEAAKRCLAETLALDPSHLEAWEEFKRL